MPGGATLKPPNHPLRPENLVTEVTDHRGKVIPNLYAAGEVTGE